MQSSQGFDVEGHKKRFFELTGADAPHFGHSSDPNGFYQRVLQAFFALGNQREMMVAAILKDYSLHLLFNDPSAQRELTTIPTLPAVEKALDEPFQSFLLSRIYTPAKFVEKMTSGNSGSRWTYLQNRVKELSDTAEKTEPFHSGLTALKAQQRAIKSQNPWLFFDSQQPGGDEGGSRGRGRGRGRGKVVSPGAAEEALPPPEVQAEVKNALQALEAQYAAIEADWRNSPAYLHHKHFEVVVNRYLEHFGTNRFTAAMKLAEKKLSSDSRVRGDTAEYEAVEKSFESQTSPLRTVLLRAETSRFPQKYNLRALATLDFAAEMARAAKAMNLGGRAPRDAADPPQALGSPQVETLDAYHASCRQRGLPHLVLLDNITYSTPFGLNGEIDFAVVDLIDGEVLLLVEVKASPADTVYARSQRSRLEAALNIGSANQSIRFSTTKCTFIQPALSAAQFAPFFLTRQAFGQRWVYMTSANLPPHVPPVYSSILHIARRELVSVVAEQALPRWVAAVPGRTELLRQAVSGDEKALVDFGDQFSADIPNWCRALNYVNPTKSLKHFWYDAVNSSSLSLPAPQQEQGADRGRGRGMGMEPERGRGSGRGGGGHPPPATYSTPPTLPTPFQLYQELKSQGLLENFIFF
jgi:hypothetical protein